MDMEIAVRNAAQAVQAALAFLRRKDAVNAPAADAVWQEKTLYSPESQDMAVTSRLFICGDWTIEVSQGVAPLSRTVYQVTVFNSKLRRYWKGSVRADGEVTGDETFKAISEDESRHLADEFLAKTRVLPPRPGGYGH
jgi:hypothetical protein